MLLWHYVAKERNVQISSPFLIICDVLRDLVPLVHSKKREKHPCRSVTFSKVAGLL